MQEWAAVRINAALGNFHKYILVFTGGKRERDKSDRDKRERDKRDRRQERTGQERQRQERKGQERQGQERKGQERQRQERGSEGWGGRRPGDGAEDHVLAVEPVRAAGFGEVSLFQADCLVGTP